MQFEASCAGWVDPTIDTEICSGMQSLTKWYNERLSRSGHGRPRAVLVVASPLANTATASGQAFGKSRRVDAESLTKN